MDEVQEERDAFKVTVAKLLSYNFCKYVNYKIKI
jgi:hypothetical protein